MTEPTLSDGLDTRLRHHPVIAALAGLVALIFLALALALGLTIAHHLMPPFDPLYFPTDHTATATVRVGQDVTVTATRCNRSKEPVTYHATKAWVTVGAAAGSTIVVGTTSATEQPGCTNFAFVNPMPPLVISRTEGLLSTGRYPNGVEWEITAVDTPEGHANAQTVSWSTTPILVTP